MNSTTKGNAYMEGGKGMIVNVRIEVYDDTELEDIENRIDEALQGVDSTYYAEEGGSEA